jgi:hypothetical protein
MVAQIPEAMCTEDQPKTSFALQRQRNRLTLMAMVALLLLAASPAAAPFERSRLEAKNTVLRRQLMGWSAVWKAASTLPAAIVSSSFSSIVGFVDLQGDNDRLSRDPCAPVSTLLAVFGTGTDSRTNQPNLPFIITAIKDV